ncbi:MAG TPA: response regulator [Thermoplasmata archaeon]|nr:response regulator [Thermoplasmata archaeon]
MTAPPPRILIVEDNPQNLKLVSVIMRGEGYVVVGAQDAVEAQQRIEESPPDLILMDIGLPGMDGYTLTRELRRRSDTTSIPIVAVTSFAMKGDEEKAREAGCAGYITKPIDRRELLRTVRELLGPTPGTTAAPME